MAMQKLLTAPEAMRDAAADRRNRRRPGLERRPATRSPPAARNATWRATSSPAELTVADRLRRRLSEDLTPAEIAALTEQLRLQLIEVRHRRDAQLDREAALALAEAAREPAAAAAAAAGVRRRRGSRNGACRGGGGQPPGASAGAPRLAEEPAVSASRTAPDGWSPTPIPPPSTPPPRSAGGGRPSRPTCGTRARTRAGGRDDAAGRRGRALGEAESRLREVRQNELGPEVELELAAARRSPRPRGAAEPTPCCAARTASTRPWACSPRLAASRPADRGRSRRRSPMPARPPAPTPAGLEAAARPGGRHLALAPRDRRSRQRLALLAAGRRRRRRERCRHHPPERRRLTCAEGDLDHRRGRFHRRPPSGPRRPGRPPCRTPLLGRPGGHSTAPAELIHGLRTLDSACLETALETTARTSW